MNSYSRKLIDRYRHEEDGFSLPELLVVMLIIGILLTLGIGAYLRAQRNAENTQVRDKVSTAYKTVLNCKTENDGFFGQYTDITGDYCLGSKIVNNNIKLCQLGKGAGGDGACADASTTRSCWDTRADGRDVNGDPVIGANANAYDDLLNSPAYDASSARIFNVGVCTFKRVGTGASTNEGSSVGNQNTEDSQFIRLSAHRNGKAYFFVEEPGGFAACAGPVDDAGHLTDKLRCQA